MFLDFTIMNETRALVMRLLVVFGMATRSIAFTPSSHAFASYRVVMGGAPPSSALHAIIIEPPSTHGDDTDSEESFFDRKRREKAEADNAMKERYRNERGIELTDVDLMDSPDQYRNSQLGGGLVSGVNLSALCEDD
jgi:hypothetical protein